MSDGRVWPGATEGKLRKSVCAQGTDKRGAEDRSAHLSTSALGAGEAPTAPGGSRCPAPGRGCSSAGTPHRRTPSRGPIFHCQGPAAAQFIMATFGNYPCKHGVIPPGKDLIVNTVWCVSAKAAGIWAVRGLPAEPQARGKGKSRRWPGSGCPTPSQDATPMA